MSVCIVTPVKNEERYIKEWLTYHAALGFDTIYLYDNNDDQATLAKHLEDFVCSAQVVIIPMPGELAQMRGYSHWMQYFKNAHKAVAIIDVDEFIVLRKHTSIHAFLEEHLYPHGGALSLNWSLFGDNGLTVYEDKPVTERFTRCKANVDEHVKSIAVTSDLTSLTNPHFPNLVYGKVQRDTNGRLFHGPFNPNGPCDVAQINHYFCKTKEEWDLKARRGRADLPHSAPKRDPTEFGKHNFNDIEDTTAHDIFRAIISA